MRRLAFLTVAALMTLCVSAGGVISDLPAAGSRVALTFDDGPHPAYTDEILDILAEYGVKATFFVIGSNVEQYPDKVRRAVSQGHEIGNHTYDHLYIKNLSDDELRSQIEKTDRAVMDAAGVRPRVFRPPGGLYSDRAVGTVNDTGHECVLWSWRQDTRDWSCPSVDSVVSVITDNIRGGDIILCHDFNAGKSPTPAALRRVIPRLLEQGYEFVTVSELIAAARPQS